MFQLSSLTEDLIISTPAKLVEFTNIPPPQILANPSKDKKNKPKTNEKPGNGKPANKTNPSGCSYIQVSSSNIQEILKLKKNFPKLSDKKIEEIHKIINNSNVSKP